MKLSTHTHKVIIPLPEGCDDDLATIRNARSLIRNGDDTERDMAVQDKTDAQLCLSEDSGTIAKAIVAASVHLADRIRSEGGSDRQSKAAARHLRMKATMTIYRAKRK